MAGSVNKVILVGRLGKDPETRFTPSGKAVTNFSMATSESWKDAGGERQEKTEWHKVQIWGPLAEISAKYLSKGKLVYIEGRLQTREWEDQSGGKRYTTEIVANNMTMLDGKGDNSEKPNNPEKPESLESPNNHGGLSPDDLDQIPF